MLSAVSCYFMCQVGLKQLCWCCRHALPVLTNLPSPSCWRSEVHVCGQPVHSVRDLQLRCTQPLSWPAGWVHVQGADPLCPLLLPPSQGGLQHIGHPQVAAQVHKAAWSHKAKT